MVAASWSETGVPIIFVDLLAETAMLAQIILASALNFALVAPSSHPSPQGSDTAYYSPVTYLTRVPSGIIQR